MTFKLHETVTLMPGSQGTVGSDMVPYIGKEFTILIVNVDLSGEQYHMPIPNMTYYAVAHDDGTCLFAAEVLLRKLPPQNNVTSWHAMAHIWIPDPHQQEH